MIYTNDSKHGGTFQAVIDENLKRLEEVSIASGYVGHETVTQLQKRLVALAETKRVRLLIGMIFHSGVGQKQLSVLTGLHEKLASKGTGSGVYVSLVEYHGKIYGFGDAMYVGSSNLSEAGINSRLECMTRVDDGATSIQVREFLDHLFSSKVSASLDKVDLERKTADPSVAERLQEYMVPAVPFDQVIGNMEIRLRVEKQPRSSLNLYFDQGRVSRTTGKYSPRPWYEIEITTETEDRLNPLYPKTVRLHPEKKSMVGSFNAYITFRQKIYRIRMSVGSDFGKAIASSEDSGGRATLGFIIKSKLEDRKVLKYGERITAQTLEDYGRDSLTLKKLDDDNYILEF